jgi:hypothetical protein
MGSIFGSRQQPLIRRKKLSRALLLVLLLAGQEGRWDRQRAALLLGAAGVKARLMGA